MLNLKTTPNKTQLAQQTIIFDYFYYFFFKGFIFWKQKTHYFFLTLN